MFFTAALCFSFITNDEKGDTEYKGVFIGKKVAETPFADYIKEDLSGDNMILIVSFSCSECVELTNKTGKLQEAGLLKNIIVLGSTFGESGEDSLKADFKTKISLKTESFYDFDPEFKVFYKKLLAIDPKYPTAKHAIYVKDGVITKIYLQLPEQKSFQKVVKK
jgi:hypothetical protein